MKETVGLKLEINTEVQSLIIDQNMQEIDLETDQIQMNA